MAGPANRMTWVLQRLGMLLALSLLLSGPVLAPAESSSERGPVLSDVSPRAASPGTAVTLTGHSFGSPRVTSFVSFAGVKARILSWTNSEITVQVPSRAIAGYIGVTVDNITSNGIWFVPANRPTVTALSAGYAPPGTSITIYGRGFGRSKRAGWVTFSGTRAAVTSWSDTRIVATVPRVSGITYVGVWQSVPSNGKLFVPVMLPDLADVSAQSTTWWGPPGTPVTLKGRRFGSAEKVTFGGVEAAFTVDSATQITATVPHGAVEGYVGVWKSGGCSNGRWFLPTRRPSIESTGPISAGFGDSVTITGTDFGSSSARSEVRIGGVPAPVISWSDTSVTFRVPVGASSGYVGVWRSGLASNGVWLELR